MTYLDTLKKLAQAADCNTEWLQDGIDVRMPEGGIVCWTRATSDARYIAACSPERILAMLAVIDAAKAIRYANYDETRQAFDAALAALAKLEQS